MSGRQRAGGRALRRGRGRSRGRGSTASTTHCNRAVLIRVRPRGRGHMHGPVVIERVIGGNLARVHVFVDPRLPEFNFGPADAAPQIKQLDALTPG